MNCKVAALVGALMCLAGVPLCAAELQSKELAPLAAPVTSFGAAVCDDGYLYTYGGHLGAPHEYSAEMQSNQLLRLNLARPDAWETVGQGPRRTGVALVSHAGKLYRVGGWEAKKAEEGEKWNLHSSRDFARFDPKSGQWQDLAPLPEGRSSHDVAVSGGRVYVVGGWELSGKGDGKWHNTAYVCNLADEKPAWKEIAKPGFRRRALAVAAYQDKVYAIGGMDDSGETVATVNVFSPESNQWQAGPALPGKGADGFGVSAIGSPSGLYASTAAGSLYRLADDGKSWAELGKLKHARFFHRLVATDGGLIAVGGTSRGAGKVSQVELLSLAPQKVVSP